jgi:hypothetical protein
VCFHQFSTPNGEIVLICNFIYLSHSQALARQLQAEEDAHAQQEYAKQLREREKNLEAKTRETKGVRFDEGRGGRQFNGKDQRNKEKKDKCIIM